MHKILIGFWGVSLGLFFLPNLVLADAVIHYVHDDYLSGSHVVTDKNGKAEEVTDYLPYGKLRFDQVSTNFKEKTKFAGHTYDSDTSLSYMKARYYDGKVGKFQSEDPMFRDIGTDLKKYETTQEQLLSNPQELNSYSYVTNNPLKFRDPTGEKVELVARHVPGTFGQGVHYFYGITPDHPKEINIAGVPQGTTEFTFGGYVKGANVFTNTLQKGVGYEGHETSDFAIYKNDPIAKVTITPPNGKTDTQLINDMGTAYAAIPTDVRYFGLSHVPGMYNGNSNNFVHDLGERVGIANQVEKFDAKGVHPGTNHSLPSTSVYKFMQNIFKK